MFKRKNDQVFPTSLSEIAFVLVFLLMLLLGYMVIREQREKEEAQKQLAKVAQVKSAEAIMVAVQEASDQLTQRLAAGGHPKPVEVITQLRETTEVRVERDALRQQVRELNENLSALAELRMKIAKAGRSEESVIEQELESALALQTQVRRLIEDEMLAQQNLPGADRVARTKPLDVKQALVEVKQAVASSREIRKQIKEKLGRNVKSGDEVSALREVVAAAKSFDDLSKHKAAPEALKKENSDLRGQLAYVSKQLNAKGGLDHAPCWADEKGKIEYLFNMETRPDGFAVSKAWLPHRDQEAKALPGIEQALAGGTISAATFAATMQPILNWSKRQDPECRHFVYLSTSISDGNARDDARKHVEAFFYKLERRAAR